MELALQSHEPVVVGDVVNVVVHAETTAVSDVDLLCRQTKHVTNARATTTSVRSIAVRGDREAEMYDN